MANNKIVKDTSRFRLVDPNNFDNQYAGSNDLAYNMSVPLEDLSISVKLTTSTKSRTILSKTNNAVVNITNGTDSKNGVVNIDFIGGTIDNQTGYEPYLTTNYTELSTELKDIDEALGITSIDINFDSSYAPLINIKFIDIRGGAIFQNGAKSKYSVFFKLPYPLFELTIKGYYGKPVKYCLHMLKCNTKFNSQTGNFEIDAQFIGYTYAMLSDMIIGLLKGAAETSAGKKLLKDRGVTSINDFLRKVSNIDQLVKDKLLNTSDEDTNNLSLLSELKIDLESLQEEIKNSVLYKFDNDKFELSEDYRNTYAVTRPSVDNYQAFGSILTDITNKITDYNNKVSSVPELIIDNKKGQPKYVLLTTLELNENRQSLYEKIYKTYNVPSNSISEADSIIARLKSVISTITNRNRDEILVIYDFSELTILINSVLQILVNKQNELTKLVAQKLKSVFVSEVGVDTSIRSIFNLFTTHIEIFLTQLAQVSAKYKDPQRVAELKKILKESDIPNKELVIYPWPEYSENNVEKYLGSVVKNIDAVPELKFVEEIYQGILASNKVIDEINNKSVDENLGWVGVNPLDVTITNGNKSPYDRIENNSTHDDIMRLSLLRFISIDGFSNKYLSVDEIKKIADSESQLILKKYSGGDNKILNLIVNNYDTVSKFSNITGTINGKNTKVLNQETNQYTYNYIYDNNERKVLPLSFGFNKTTYREGSEQDSAGDFLTNTTANINETANLIKFIDKSEYNNGSGGLTSFNESVFNFDILKNKIVLDGSTQDQLKNIGFFIGSGKYGIQEFNKIQYNGFPTSSPFYSLFYNNGTDFVNIDKTFFTPTLCTTRKATSKDYKTIYDISNTIRLIPDLNLTDLYDKTSINIIYKNRKTYGNTYKQITDTTNTLNSSDVSYPFLNFNVKYRDPSDFSNKNIGISLFGSRFYNSQSLLGKTFLFLNCLPFKQLIPKLLDNDENSIFSFELLNTLNFRSGFVQIPKLWPAYIGSLLWRHNRQSDPIVFTTVNGTSIIPFIDTFPDKNQYLKPPVISEYFTAGMGFTNDYANIEDTLINLPNNVKIQFIKEFLKFSKEYNNIRQNFELVMKNGDSDSAWINTWELLNNNVKKDSNDNNVIDLNLIKDNIKILNGNDITKSLKVITFLPTDAYIFAYNMKYNYILEYSEETESDPANILKNLILDYQYLSNNSIFIWSNDNKDVNSFKDYSSVTFKTSDLSIFHSNLINNLKNYVSENQQKRYNNNELYEIKLELYRTLKKIYDKWVANTDDPENIIFQCCKKPSDRLSSDKMINQKYNNNQSLRLIDSFRFVTRSFKDISEEFQINPLIIYKLLMENTNISFADLTSRVLTDNNFEFIALPSFVNFNDPNEVESMFKPYPFYEAVNNSISGPSFVCVYVGQNSTKLDFGKDSEYLNDGFDLNGNKLPPDFTENKQAWEDTNAAFIVRYGQQNQNIFKDVTLDQTEFGETIESLQILDNIGNSYSSTNQQYIGQNLYNVYSVRSYKAEIEMLGNAMIQPMMYFQLDNIPMFHGAYLITKVKHNIKPNHMTTVFTGSRIRFTQTPIVDVASLYGGLLNTFELPNSNTTNKLTNTAVLTAPPIVLTIINNGGSNGNPTNGTGNIRLKKVPQINGVLNQKYNASNNGDSLLSEATDALVLMLNDFVQYAKTNNFKSINNKYISLTSLFRDLATQERLYNESGGNGSVARAGRSNHGWGIAVDFKFISNNGQEINNSITNLDNGFDLNQNPSLKWLLDNSYKYGYIIPYTLRDGSNIDEFWHFEYHGKSAKCLLLEHPNVRGYIISPNQDYMSIRNPLDRSGQESKYDANNCKYVSVKVGDGSETSINTTPSKKELEDNQVIVKNYLKTYFKNVLKLNETTSKIIIAGIMGNIQAESNFNPSASGIDTNGALSCGLIQWNQKTYVDVRNKILGKSTEEQTIKIVDGYTNNFTKFINKCIATTNLTPWYSAFYFAQLVEICKYCTNETDYRNDNKYKQSNRSKYANNFFERFGKSDDKLFW